MTIINPNRITPEEWRTAAKVARRSIFGNSELADAWENVAKYSSAADLTTQLAKAIRAAWVDRLDWDELAHAALKFLTATGRLVPAGGMALTAEQVEDVRTILTRKLLSPGHSEWAPFNSALNRLRALFPATEPAEDSVGDPLQAWKEFLKPKPIGWYRTMTRKFATEHFGFPEVTGLLECTHTASDGGTWGWGGDGDWELLVYPPAPSEPAEEDTKAKQCAVRLCVLPARHSGVHADREGLRWNNPASSPVVPAPTETGPWQTWEAVPDDVWFTSTSAVGFLPAHRKRGGLVDWQFRDGSVGVYDVSRIGNGKLMCRAPFVAAEEKS